eukprot:3782107-Amphidinium_carterae.1
MKSPQIHHGFALRICFAVKFFHAGRNRVDAIRSPDLISMALLAVAPTHNGGSRKRAPIS